MKYIFGPVRSRRLGRSLGIDLFPSKICNFDCVYCEVGPSPALYHIRKKYSPTKDILLEITTAFQDESFSDQIDVCTLTSSGEPTLHSDFGLILSHLKQTSSKPVVVLTNGSTMDSPQVRQELSLADIVIPSLDAATPAAFQRVDRPHAAIEVEKIIEGLTAFSRSFTGQLWLEVLFVQNMNDSIEEIEALTRAIESIRPDRLQLNTVFRPPATSSAHPISGDQMRKIADLLKQKLSTPIDLPAPSSQVETPACAEDKDEAASSAQVSIDGILQMIQRRPCTAADISKTHNIGSSKKVKQLLEPLVYEGKIRTYTHEGHLFYQYVQSLNA
ncbi:radical SAM protein [Desulfogranum japonicum]|uniref:radical SAM protein n=1 Tax=Desulfogranum japonicum TaxID=231447 RepID=UPI00040ABE81|nr:radical SAM protein [Desulfogranum japonicum]